MAMSENVTVSEKTRTLDSESSERSHSGFDLAGKMLLFPLQLFHDEGMRSDVLDMVMFDSFESSTFN